MSDLLQFAPPPGDQSGHPDADQLTAFAEHALRGHERAQTLAHLAVCPTCRQIVFLAQAAEPELLPQPAHPSKPLFAGWTLAWISAAVLAAAAILTVTLRHRATPTPVTRASVEQFPPVAAANPSPAVEPLPPLEREAVPRAKLAPPPPAPAAAPPAGSLIVDGRSQVETEQSQSPPYSPFLRQRVAAPPAVVPPPAIHGALAYGSGSGVAMGAAAPAIPPPAKPAPVVLGGLAPASPQPQAAAPPPQVAIQQGAANVDQASATIVTGKELDAVSDAVSDAASNEVAAPLRSLPSHLPIASSIAKGAKTVAIDTGGAVFVSRNRGKHWDSVAAIWPGRAVRVSLVESADEGRGGAPQANAKPPVFRLATDTGAIYTSTDGKTWKPQ
jgi:hypothetical protein